MMEKSVNSSTWYDLEKIVVTQILGQPDKLKVQYVVKLMSDTVCNKTMLKQEHEVSHLTNNAIWQVLQE